MLPGPIGREETGVKEEGMETKGIEEDEDYM